MADNMSLWWERFRAYYIGCGFNGHDPEPKMPFRIRRCARCGDRAPDSLQPEDVMAVTEVELAVADALALLGDALAEMVPTVEAATQELFEAVIEGCRNG